MAKATFVIAKPVKQPPNKVILELTEGEADLIYFLVGRVTGSSNNSPRKYADRIHHALSAALGYMSVQSDAYRLANNAYQHFADYPADQAAKWSRLVERYVIP